MIGLDRLRKGKIGGGGGLASFSGIASLKKLAIETFSAEDGGTDWMAARGAASIAIGLDAMDGVAVGRGGEVAVVTEMFGTGPLYLRDDTSEDLDVDAAL